MGRLAFLALCGLAAFIGADGAARNFNAPTCGTLVAPRPCDARDTGQQTAAHSIQRVDTPNDPDYDRAETDDEDAGTVTASTNLYDERFDLFGFASVLTPGAVYKEGPLMGSPMISGFNAAGAWKAERGRGDVVVAILDTGVRWDRSGLRTQVHLNAGELPVPNHNRATAISDAGSVPACSAFTNAYDANGDGVFNVLDYVCDDRVSITTTQDAQGRGGHGDGTHLTAEDLIVAFSDGVDTDGNGYVDDIAGWDFYNDDNDPWDASSYFAAANHGSGRAGEAIERGDDGEGEIGVCPHCQFVPLRVWDTFVADPNNFGMAVVYAADNGVSVIEGADGATSHTAFMEAASEYAYQHGLVQVFSGDDLNTGNHNYPAAYSHAMLILGTVPDNINQVSNDPAASAGCFMNHCSPQNPNFPVGTYFRSANTDQYGGKGSLSMEGATGSENTGKSSGAAALVISAGRDASITLRPDEVRAILEQTAERVTSLNTQGNGTPDPAASASAASLDQWSDHFGWGRVNLGAAVSLAAGGKIPPEAAIYSPDWYAPVTANTLPITGLARARFAAGAFHWKLEWGAGHAPTSWTTACENDGTAGSTVSTFCSINLNDVRTALAKPANTVPPDSGGPTFSPTAPNPYQQQFAVRLVVTDKDTSANGLPVPGVDRRIFTAFTDGTLRPGYPMRLGAGGESPLRYADLDGDNVPELVVPTEDGQVRVLKKDGSSLAGFPVTTQIQFNAVNHSAAPGIAALSAATPPREELRGPAIVDLDGDGIPEIIDVAGIHLYVWEPDGSLRPGFPVAIGDNTGFDAFCKGADQKQGHGGGLGLGAVRRKCGFIGSPAVGHVNTNDATENDIVVAALDGHVYAFDPSGVAVPHFPVNLVDPAAAPADQELAEIINDVALGKLAGDTTDDIVVATNEAYVKENPDQSTITGGSNAVLVAALAQAAGGTSRIYAIRGKDGTILPGWPLHLAGAIQSTLPLIGPGHDAAIAKVGSTTNIFVSTTGGIVAAYDATGARTAAMQQGTYGSNSNATDKSGQFNLFESLSLGDLTGQGHLDVVKYGLSLGGVTNLLLPGDNQPYNHLIGAYDAQTGASLPFFPTITDDYQFLSASTVGQVVASQGGSNQVLAGTGLGLVHAYDGVTGLDATGFPKQTGGWLFAPPELSQDGRLATISREGFLFEWDLTGGDPTKAIACQPQWPTFRHDRRASGNFDTDGTPPDAVSNAGQSRDASNHVHVQWLAPGDDGPCGTATSYKVSIDNVPVATTVTPDAAGTPQSADLGVLANSAHTVVVQAVDKAGNVGYPVPIAIPAVTGGGPLSGLVTTLAPINVQGRTGDNVGAGSFTLKNNGTLAHTVSAIALQVSTPAAFSSLTLNLGSASVTVTPVTGTATFTFPQPITLAPAAAHSFTLSAALSTKDTALRDSWTGFSTAYAGDGAGARSTPLVTLAAVLMLALLLMRLDRRLAAATLALALLLAGCAGGSGSSNSSSPPPAGKTYVSTVDLSSVTAQAGNIPVTYSPLPARLSTVTRKP